MNIFNRVSNKRFKEIKKNIIATGWVDEFNRAYENKEYAVLVRTIKTKYGLCKHAAIRNLESSEISWKDKQEIKNLIFGKNSIAVEIFPAADKLVDEEMMYHLWILSDEFYFPFNLHGKEGNK